jgi:hypothetical protein
MWACDEFLTKKRKVLWVHLRKDGPAVYLLMKEGKVFEVKDADADYVKFSDADVIVIDGIVEDFSHKKYRQNLFQWTGYRAHRKCIQVASMQLRTNDEDDAVMEVLDFEMSPWTLEEYFAACHDDLFFASVSWAFEGLKGEEREDVIAEKFFYTGCSARWMFSYTTQEVVAKISKQLRKCDNFNDLIHGGGGDASKSAVNHLWVGYPLGNGIGFSNFFVSQAVCREMLRKGGSAVIQVAYSFARDLKNPALLGWVVEMDFVQYLQDCIRVNSQAKVWTFSAHGIADEKKWAVPGIVDFELNTIESLKASVLKHYWLRPSKWNQGGYDLACLVCVNGRYVLRFIQITAAHEHSLKLKYFRELAFKINETFEEIEVKHIEIIMLVPERQRANQFRIPHSKVANSGDLTPWYCGDSMDKWRRYKEEEQVQVYWFESRLP